MPVRFLLNGSPLEVSEDQIEGPHLSLLSLLRRRGLTGSKEGCAEGECGACAVALVSDEAAGGPLRFRPVNACLLPVGAVHGRSVISVEGVAAPDAGLHPVQTALVEHGASQCGYCTPGFVVSLFCEYYRPGREDYDPEAISGNLCRCTGYRPISAAARALPKARDDDAKRRLCVLPDVAADEPTFYLRPRSLRALFEAWAAQPSATLISGGTDLMVDANQRGTRFETLISLESVAELRSFERGEHELRIGAGLTLEALAEQSHGVALIAQLLPTFASRLIRNRASLGGNLASASPIGDAAPVLLALDATLELVSAHGRRRLALDRFFVGYRKTALAPGELIERVAIPLPLPSFQRFYKVSKRQLDDISSVACAFALELDAERHVTRLRVAYGGIAATPLRAHSVEQLALGKPWTRATLRELLEALHSTGEPITDHRASADYRRAMRGSLLEKFWFESSAELSP